EKRDPSPEHDRVAEHENAAVAGRLGLLALDVAQAVRVGRGKRLAQVGLLVAIILAQLVAQDRVARDVVRGFRLIAPPALARRRAPRETHGGFGQAEPENRESNKQKRVGGLVRHASSSSSSPPALGFARRTSKNSSSSKAGITFSCASSSVRF